MVLGLTALVAWRVVAAEMREDVSVAWSGPVACEGTTVRSEPVGDGEEPVPVIRLREGMRCTVPVRVTNAGRGSVRVLRLRVPLLGPEAGAAVQAAGVDGMPPSRPDAVDAVFRVDRPLAGGESQDFDLELTFRSPPQGCTSPGSRVVVGPVPRVTVLALGRPGERRAPESLAFRGTRHSSCGG